MGELRNAYKIFSGSIEGKRPFGRPINERTILKWVFWEQV
jgi:hypothetical protein